MYLLKRALMLALLGCFMCGWSTQATADDRPIRLAVTDIYGLEELQREFEAFKTTLSEKLGRPVKFFPVTNRTAVVEALRSKKLDFALTGPAEYVIIRKKSGATPVVSFSRPDYFSAIVTLSKYGYSSLEDLKGKQVAFGDFGSTSYHLAPMQIFKLHKINPKEDLKILHVSKNVAWEALKREKVAAAALNHERFRQYRDQEKEMRPGSFRVLARSPDLPSDVLVAAAHVDQETIELVRRTFGDNSDSLIAAIMKGERNNKYHGMEFLTNVKDDDYDIVRDMYAAIGYPEFSDFIGES